MNEPFHDQSNYPFVDTSGWQPPVAGTPNYAPPVELRRFNRSYFDRQDPLEDAGYELELFGVSVCYPVDRAVQQNLLNNLRETVWDRFSRTSVPGARPQFVDFDDAITGGAETPRRYLVLRGETIRGTYMTVFATFLSNGDYVYVSVDSYVLPPTHRWRLFVALVLTGFGIILSGGPGMWLIYLRNFVLGSAPHFNDFASALMNMAMFGLFLSATYYLRVVRSLFGGDNLRLALRRKFHRWKPSSTFDSDDVSAFFKSSLKVMIYGIQDVFDAYGIPVDVLERTIQNINMSTSVTNTGNMTILGSVTGATTSTIAGH